MADSKWISAEYAYGWIEGKPGILRRGGNFYQAHVTINDLPWRPCAAFTDRDDGDIARRCVVALNTGPEPEQPEPPDDAGDAAFRSMRTRET